MTAAPHTPTGVFADFDGSASQGPMLIQQGGDVLSFDITFKSTSPNRGLLAKLIDAADVLGKALFGARVQSGPLVNGSGAVVNLDGAATATPSGTLYQGLHLPHGSVLTQLSITVDPATHTTLSDITKPVITLRRIEVATGTIEQLASVSDPSLTAAAYSALHTITISGLTHRVNANDYYYWAQYAHEFGSGAVNGSVLPFRTVVKAP